MLHLFQIWSDKIKNLKDNKHLNNDDLKPRKWLLYLLIIVNIVIIIVLGNKVVTYYNTLIETVPSNIVASIFAFKKAQLFEINDDRRDNIKIGL